VRGGARGRMGLVATIGPVAVGVMLALAWNMATSQPPGAAGDEPGVTPQVGLTVQQAAEQAWARATPRGPAENPPGGSAGHPPGGSAGHPPGGSAGGRHGTRPARSG
jgi:hypothetical protein